MISDVSPMQRAVMYMANRPWNIRGLIVSNGVSVYAQAVSFIWAGIMNGEKNVFSD